MSTAEELKKLTVPQLLALCRERKLTCYSKLKKAQLIEKLAPSSATTATAVADSAAAFTSPNYLPVALGTSHSASVPIASLAGASCPADVAILPVLPSMVQKLHPIQTPLQEKNQAFVLVEDARAPDQPERTVSKPFSPTASNAQRSPSTIDMRLDSVQKSLGIPSNLPKSPRKRSSISQSENEPIKRARVILSMIPTTSVINKKSQQADSLPKRSESPELSYGKTPTAGPSKQHQISRFVPLMPKPHTQRHSNSGPRIPIQSSDSPTVVATTFADFSVKDEYTDPLKSITLPPSLSQRGGVKHLALLLRDVGPSDRQACCLASRTMRYSSYVSAQFILYREFPGRRTEAILARAHDSYTNLWPFLRFRRAEKKRLKMLYEQCLLFRFVPNPMSDQLWGNQDTGEEVALALRYAPEVIVIWWRLIQNRFSLARLWYGVSLYGDSGQVFLQETLLSLQALPGNEIWKAIVLRTDDTTYPLFVLESTGEPLGWQPNLDPWEERGLRLDWLQFIEGSVRGGGSLQSHLQCANEEDYTNGVSMAWLRRLEHEGLHARAKSIVAERYVLASVVANSVSGKRMSIQQMAMQIAGLPVNGLRRPQSAINLYLPEQHHVESVHFVSVSRAPLHPFLASVQTPHREYFVLRDNGLQIGCEEDGVSPTWMEILGVNRDGTRCT